MSGMKSKTIAKILKFKMNAWINSIEDDTVKELAKRDTIVTGGCIASMLLGEDVNDFDVYFKTNDTAKAVADYYVERFKASKKTQGGIAVDISVAVKDSLIQKKPQVYIKVKSAGVANANQTDDYQYFETVNDEDSVSNYVENAVAKAVPQMAERQSQKMYEPVFLSANAITLTGDVQLVLRFTGNASEIHENYDFVHCTNYYELDGNKLVLRPEALECILSKTLQYQGSLYPVCSMIRTRKFIKREWKISAGQYLKMAFQIGELDLTDIDVLQEQLTGVDAAYFAELISKIEDVNAIDGTYIAKLVDEIM